MLVARPARSPMVARGYADRLLMLVVIMADHTLTTATSTCGDGVRSEGEECDDGNSADDDGCSVSCKIDLGFACFSSTGGVGLGDLDTCTHVCGDGKRASWIETDECDDNNVIAGDGCSESCAIEPGFHCSGGNMTSTDTCVAPPPPLPPSPPRSTHHSLP